MTRRCHAYVLAASTLAMVAAPALAQTDLDTVGRLAAVQPRPFHLFHELEFSLVYLPFDAFYEGLGPEVSYTYHFNDRLAWEVIRGFYSFDVQTNLRSVLETQFPTVLEPT